MEPSAVDVILLAGALAGASIAAVVAVVSVVQRLRPRWLTPVVRWLRERMADDDGRPYEYGWTPSPEHYRFASFETKKRTEAPGGLDAQSPEWRAALAALGERMRRRGVRRIVFVHGTFVGDDPLALVHQWQSFLTGLDPRLGPAIRGITKKQLDRLIGDAGNFSADYVDLVADAFERELPCRLFVWSSSNHHVARLRAARDLVLDLAGPEGGPARRRILLVGHSHAGQVFALVTHLLAGSRIGIRLFDVLAAEARAPREVDQLHRALRAVRRARCDFVTLGTPPRYGYCVHPDRRRVLHLVNHRGPTPRGGAVSGVLHTRAGDYVQQWGVAGSDLTAQNPRDQETNRALDALLGAGANKTLWLEHVRARPRVHRDGRTVLVDYGDASRFQPNFYGTGLGHAVYTTQRMLRFNLELIGEDLYRA